MSTEDPTIEHLVRRFETCSLRAGEWNHEAHLMVAIWNVLNTSPDNLVSKVRDDIRRYNEATGTPNTDHGGYHETITIFWLKVVEAFIAINGFKDAGLTWRTLQHSDLRERTLLLEFYSRDVLFSTAARRQWISPDRQPIELVDGRVTSSLRSHYAFTDADLVAGLLNGSLEPSRFTHEAHLRLAFITLSSDGDNAEDEVCSTIEAYVTHLGAQSKFHKTLTIAAVKTVRHFMNRSTTRTFYELLTEFPRLRSNFRDLIAAHYGFDIYNSERAKREFVEPDLQPYY